MIRYYFDTHIAKAIADQLRARNIDVLRCEEVGLGQADDESHLIFAAGENRVMITQDADFAILHQEWMLSGRNHAGIMRVPPSLQSEVQISFVVRELAFYHEAAQIGALDVPSDISNQLIYL